MKFRNSPFALIVTPVVCFFVGFFLILILKGPLHLHLGRGAEAAPGSDSETGEVTVPPAAEETAAAGEGDDPQFDSEMIPEGETSVPELPEQTPAPVITPEPVPTPRPELKTVLGRMFNDKNNSFSNNAFGAEWIIYVENLTDGSAGPVVWNHDGVFFDIEEWNARDENSRLLAANLMDLWIMGAVYYYYPSPGAEIQDALSNMILYADTNSANWLVRDVLGEGIREIGLNRINFFIATQGATHTYMNRMYSDLVALTDADNYTSARDCAMLLKKIYFADSQLNGSREMAELLIQAYDWEILPDNVKAHTVLQYGGLQQIDKQWLQSATVSIGSHDTANQLFIFSDGTQTYLVCILSTFINSIAEGIKDDSCAVQVLADYFALN